MKDQYFKLNRKIKVENEDPSIQLAENSSLLQGKLDIVLEEDEQLKLTSDNILSQLVQINTQTPQKNIKIADQSDIILQNGDILQENMPLKSKLDELHQQIDSNILPQQIDSNMLPQQMDSNMLPQQIDSNMLDSLLLNKVKKIKIDKKNPRLHAGTIWKIISYDKNKKFITCSDDKTIILRNREDNKIIRTFTDHKEAVRDILILSDGRLASSSQDKTVKIWNLTNGNCEQTLIGHSDTIYCLLELPNSMLLSGSQDSSFGVWNISQKDKKELNFHHQIKNYNQSQAYCMALINSNKLAISSYTDINIYLFDDITNKSFKIIKILRGHTDWIGEIKLMNNNNDMLVSCSDDKYCMLWSISQGKCLRVFKGHSNIIYSIQILSDKIFASASAEIIFWNVDSPEINRFIRPDQSGKMIVSLIKNDSDELIFAGVHEFIGMIKI